MILSDHKSVQAQAYSGQGFKVVVMVNEEDGRCSPRHVWCTNQADRKLALVGAEVGDEHRTRSAIGGARGQHIHALHITGSSHTFGIGQKFLECLECVEGLLRDPVVVKQAAEPAHCLAVIVVHDIHRRILHADQGAGAEGGAFRALEPFEILPAQVFILGAEHFQRGG